MKPELSCAEWAKVGGKLRIRATLTRADPNLGLGAISPYSLVMNEGNSSIARPSAAFWMGSAFCSALGVAACVLGILGIGEDGIDTALQATGRLAFIFFWLAYSGGALASLFGPMFQPLKRRAREFGLAFASVLAVHLGLVTSLCVIGATPSMRTFILFGIGVGWTFLLVFFSFGRQRELLGPKSWWLLRVVGLNYIAYIFAVDFLQDPLHGGITHVLEYLPFAALAIAGPALVLAASLQRVARGWKPSAG